MTFNLSPKMAKIILQFNPFTRLKIMCRGYNEDLKSFTELVWEDDKFLDFDDTKTYPQFQLWYV